MQAQLNKILEEAKAQLNEASTLAQTDDIRVKILGKKGKLTEILRGMGKLSPEERKTTGQMANKVRAEVEKMLEEKFEAVKAAAYRELQSNVESAAARGYVDTVIAPADTRKYVIGAFEMLFTKREDRPSKKHGTV